MSNGIDGRGTPTGGKVEGVAGMAKDKVNSMADTAHASIDRAAHAAAPAIDQMASGAQRLSEMPEEFLENCRECIREEPVKNLLIAVAAGFVLGKIL